MLIRAAIILTRGENVLRALLLMSCEGRRRREHYIRAVEVDRLVYICTFFCIVAFSASNFFLGDLRDREIREKYRVVEFIRGIITNLIAVFLLAYTFKQKFFFTLRVKEIKRVDVRAIYINNVSIANVSDLPISHLYTSLPSSYRRSCELS